MLVLVSQDFKGFLLFFSDFSYRPGQKQHCLHRRRSLPGPKGTVQISLSVFTTYKQRWTNLLQNKINYPYFSKYSVIGIIIEKKNWKENWKQHSFIITETKARIFTYYLG